MNPIYILIALVFAILVIVIFEYHNLKKSEVPEEIKNVGDINFAKNKFKERVKI